MLDKSEIRAGRERLVEALGPVLEAVRSVDPSDAGAAARLAAAFPADGDAMRALAALVREGVEAGWLCEREANGVRFSRVAMPDHPGTAPLSIDSVSMRGPGPGHTHPNGEIDLCFAVDGAPRFDGHPPGWVVYPPGSWHVPTVSGGAMDILYFLPGGDIRFEPDPRAS
ncbi:MAG: DUF4863 family protein [Alphaproteobacteria bacterium]|nr:DUF4863 family protein [Alphaproteobacteria bacterium]